MPQTLSTMANVLKIQYLGVLRDALQRIFWTWAWLKKGSLRWSGDSIVWSVRMQGTNAMSFGVGGSALNTSQRQQTVQSTINLKQAWLPIEFTYDAFVSSRDKKGAFINAMALEMDKGLGDFRDVMERVAWGDGTGKIAEVESYAAGVVTCSTMSDTAGTGLNGNAGVRYLKKGQLVDFYTSANAQRHVGALVTDVDVDNGTFDIIVGTGANPAATDGVYWHRPDGSTPIGQEPMGIPGLIDDGSVVGTLQGISRSTYPQWAAQLITAGTFAAPGSLSADLLQRMIDKGVEAGGGVDLMLWCHNDVKREVIKLGLTDVRFRPQQLQLGIKEDNKGDTSKPKNTLLFNDFRLCWAPDAPYRTLFAWPDGFIRQYPQLDGPSWVPNNPDGSGGILQRKTGVGGTYEGQLCWFGNLGTDVVKNSSASLMRHINSTIDVVQSN